MCIYQHYIKLMESALGMQNIPVPQLLTNDKEEKETRLKATKEWWTQHSDAYMEQFEETAALLRQLPQQHGSLLRDIVKDVDDAERVFSTTGVALVNNPQLVDSVNYMRNLARLMRSDIGMLKKTMMPFREDFLLIRLNEFKSDMESTYVKSACLRLLYFMRLLWRECITEDELDDYLLNKSSDEIFAIAHEKLKKIQELTPEARTVDADVMRLSTYINAPLPDKSPSDATESENGKRKIQHVEVDKDDVFGVFMAIEPLLKPSRASKSMKLLASSIVGDDGASNVSNAALINPRKVMDQTIDIFSKVLEFEKQVFEDLESCVCIFKDIEQFVSESMRTQISACKTYKLMLYLHQVIHQLHKLVALSNFMFSISIEYHKLMFNDSKQKFLISKEDTRSMLECPQSFKYMNIHLNKNIDGEREIMQSFSLDM